MMTIGDAMRFHDGIYDTPHVKICPDACEIQSNDAGKRPK